MSKVANYGLIILTHSEGRNSETLGSRIYISHFRQQVGVSARNSTQEEW